MLQESGIHEKRSGVNLCKATWFVFLVRRAFFLDIVIMLLVASDGLCRVEFLPWIDDVKSVDCVL